MILLGTYSNKIIRPYLLPLIFIFCLLALILFSDAAILSRKADAAANILPDIIVQDVTVSSGNKLQVTLMNNGPGNIPSQWLGFVEVYFNQQLKGTYSMTTPTYTTGGGITYAGGTSMFLLAIDIVQATSVYVKADSLNNIAELNEGNNSLSKTLYPLNPTPVPTYEPKPTPTQTYEPKPTPTPTYEPKPTPTQTYEPKPTPKPTYEPNPTPAQTPGQASEPTQVPNPTPTQEIKTTPEPGTNQTPSSETATTPGPGQAQQTPPFSSNAANTSPFVSPGLKSSFIQTAGRTAFATGRQQTPPPGTDAGSDTGGPDVQYSIPPVISGLQLLEIEADDGDGVDRVQFNINKKLIYTDYSDPFECPFDSSEYRDGSYDMEIDSFDALGNRTRTVISRDIRNRYPLEESPVQISVITPEPASNVYGAIQITAVITHESGARIKSAEILIDGASVKRLTFPVLETSKVISVTDLKTSRIITVAHIWDTSGLAEGSTHVIEVEAEDEFGNNSQKGIRVTKVQEPETSFAVSRTVSRNGNYFRVSLNIQNNDPLGRTISNITVRDISRGFQAASYETGTPFDCMRSEITVPKNISSLTHGAIQSITYNLVPVLFDPEICDYLIGNRTIIEYDNSEGRHVTQTYYVQYQPGDYTGAPYPLIPGEVSSAINSTDYFIVTAPERLYHYFNDNEVNTLLAGMATLAIDRNGVLAYRRTEANWFSGYTVRRNLESDGIWGKRIPLAVLARAYLLLVGETEIVPSFNVSGFNMGFNVGVIDTVRITDYPYSDIMGDERPELRVGRILGENPVEMKAQLDASIGVYLGRLNFDRSNAFLVSGTEGTWEMFIDDCRDLGTLLGSQGFTTSYSHAEYHITENELLREALVLRGDYSCLGEPGHLISGGVPCPRSHPPTDTATLRTLITVAQAEDIETARRRYDQSYTIHDTACQSGDARGLELKTGSRDCDVIFWDGHGGPGGWGWVMDDFTGSCGSTNMYIDLPSNPLNLGTTASFVFAASCLTGNYEAEAGRSGARAYLRHKAGVYIGSTEVSPAGVQQDMTIRFFRDYWNTAGLEIGDAFARLKYDTVLMSDRIWRYMVYEYNLYGDPKFGGD